MEKPEIIEAELIRTKWGRAINYKEGLAFLEYSGDHRDFEAGKTYTCEIFHMLMYAHTFRKEKGPDGRTIDIPDTNAPVSKRDWTNIEGKTLEEITNHPDYSRFDLDIKKANPWFKIRK